MLFRLAAIFAASVGVAFGQMNVGEIRGIVTDPGGGGVQGATITATNIATGVKLNTTTNDSGQYLAAQLAPGVYSVSAIAAGFKSRSRTQMWFSMPTNRSLCGLN